MTDYSLAELTDEAGVSVRTVRYYIAEGLLPPPVSAGPKSHYTQEHLDRLRLIGQLKASYLPLREIRRYLDRLDDADVRRLAEQAEVETTSGAETGTVADQLPPSLAPAPHPDSAADYLARVMNRNRTPGARPPASPITQNWRRIPLGDDAELLIREEAYRRKRDRIDWLIEWARKVLR